MAPQTKKQRVKEQPDRYYVPGQWPDNETPHSIVDPPGPSPLLSLPPELRNRIYEFALHLDKGICRVSTTSGIPEPALLLTCKEIRRDAIGIFYSENEVHMLMDSYSPALPIFLHKKIGALEKQYDCKINVAKCHLLGLRRWRNLVSWLRNVHEMAYSSVGTMIMTSKLGAPLYSHEANVGDREAAVVAGLFLSVHTMRDIPWDQVEPTLNLLRYGLTRYNSEWEVD